MKKRFKAQSSKFKAEDEKRNFVDSRNNNSNSSSNKNSGRKEKPNAETAETGRAGRARARQGDGRQEKSPKKYLANEQRARATGNEAREPDSRSASVIYGVLPVTEALRAGARRVEKVLIADGAREHRIAEIIALAKQCGVLWQKTARENLAKLVPSAANHQGVVAHVAAADYADAERLLTAIAARENSLSVVLDGVEDPRNLGAILRAVECAGADAVFLPERRAAALTETVVKSAAGATEYVRIAKVANINRLIERLKAANIWVVGTSGAATSLYTDWDWTQPTALVLGGEGKGLHRLVAENCDALVKIPMRGKIESLNVSVACGVILFEAVRQRSSKSEIQSSKSDSKTEFET